MKTTVQDIRNRAAIRGKSGAPKNVSISKKKTFAVLPLYPSEYHLRIVKIDGLIQDLLQDGIFRKALPSPTYGSFEVSEDVSDHFQYLAHHHGLDVKEVR